MKAPIALQLYTVREALEKDFDGTVARVAEMGYVGVETASFPNTTPHAAAKLFEQLGLAVCSAHVPLPIGPEQERVLELAQALGTNRLACAALGPEMYGSMAQTQRTIGMINEAAAFVAEHGLSLGIHNHWWEFEPIADGKIPYELILEGVDPAVFLEVDLYWAQVGGSQPVSLLKRLGSRAPLLHIKDGPADDPKANHVAVGSGAMDIPAVIEAGSSAEWLIVELDRCATEMLGAVEQSYRYLVGHGLARGQK